MEMIRMQTLERHQCLRPNLLFHPDHLYRLLSVKDALSRHRTPGGTHDAPDGWGIVYFLYCPAKLALEPPSGSWLPLMI
ncbi:hypothetical protein ElyMa_006485500 [Elysia marginata]|uniref:Uncharacterized protein n=1 Tax=Elysia marginata TaxID=1093978 RepID=A0AAV4I0P2_9GAST|nr:hypothetical protein ElyMa_006485500 [Elysia marginata]